MEPQAHSIKSECQKEQTPGSREHHGDMAPTTKSVVDPAELSPGRREWSFVSGYKAAVMESPFRKNVRNGDRNSSGLNNLKNKQKLVWFRKVLWGHFGTSG